MFTKPSYLFVIVLLCSNSSLSRGDIINLEFSSLPVGTVVTNQFSELGIEISAIQPFEFAGPRVSSATMLNVMSSNFSQAADVMFEFPRAADYLRFQIFDADEPSTVRVFNDGVQIFSQQFSSGSNTQVYTFEFGVVGGSIQFDSIVFDAVNSGPGNSAGPESIGNIQFSSVPESNSISLFAIMAAWAGLTRGSRRKWG